MGRDIEGRRPVAKRAGGPEARAEGRGVPPSRRGSPLAASGLLAVQRAIGNASVVRLLADQGSPLAQRYPVVRGGTCLEAQFTSGAEAVDKDGKLSGVSTNADPSGTAARSDLVASLRNNQVGVADSAAITQVGGTLKATPSRGNAYHTDLGGITAAQGQQLFTPTVKKADWVNGG